MIAAVAVAVAAAIATAAPIAIVSPASSGPAWSDVAIERLRDDVSALLAQASLRGAHVGFTAIETATGRVLFARNANDEFQPASTLKLLVGSVALDELGPQYRFESALFWAGDEPTVEHESVVFRGGGDPFLTTMDLGAAAKEIASGGSPRRLYIDAAHFDSLSHAPGWTWDDFAYPYAAAISAVVVDENVVALEAAPAATAGMQAIVTTQQPGVDVLGPNATCDVAGMSRIAVLSRAQTVPRDGEATADAAIAGDGGCLAVVGNVPVGAPSVEVDGAVPSPTLFAYATLRTELATSGVRIDAPATAGPLGIASPADLHVAREPLWRHESEPYATWLGPRFWIPSDNLVAETLLKEIGVHAFGIPGTTANGVRAETAWLRSIGVDPATTTLADGSGLSQYDRLTPNDALAILQHDWNGPNRALVLDSLPVGGARGTIEGIDGTAAAGRVFAKTGSFSHVRALAGYLAPLRHGAVTFAFDVDDWNGDYASLAATRASVLSRIVAD